MREILFRGKRTDNKQWVEGFYALVGEKKPNAYIITNNGYMVRVAHKSISEFTGLTDKNGAKIFEGDIVAFGEYRYTVEWKQDRLGYGYAETADRMLECDGEHCEVIGNIHDNPELLKGGSE